VDKKNNTTITPPTNAGIAQRQPIGQEITGLLLRLRQVVVLVTVNTFYYITTSTRLFISANPNREFSM
jgi:hypothetical protein